MVLNPQSLEWAIDFIYNHSDGDLFPKVLEMGAIYDRKSDFVSEVKGRNLSDFPVGSSRRFIVPKDDLSYRQATQLDPQDSIIFSAILHQFGDGIEKRRKSKEKVFSYRFEPDNINGFYQSQSGWNDFWAKAKIKSAECGVVLYCDISDFYNQIYHHTVDNQLINSGFPNQATKWIITLLESTTAGVSRGIPVGPHAAHLLAEATLIPVDNSLEDRGINHIRYADDILIFCSDENDARKTLFDLATILDKQQRLTLQRHKTKILPPKDFVNFCDQMVEDRPINSNEKDLLNVIRKYSKGNPYITISFNIISQADWSALGESNVSKIINEYLESSPVDFIRLRWFYRRIAQVGHPGAVNISVEKMTKLAPCLAGICSYLASVQGMSSEQWKGLGEKLVNMLKNDDYSHNEYLRLSVLSLFARNVTLNHLPDLINLFSNSAPFVRREIIFAAGNAGSVDWLREHKEAFKAMDDWQKRAFIYCAKKFPSDEKRFFLGSVNMDRVLDKILIKWAKS